MTKSSYVNDVKDGDLVVVGCLDPEGSLYPWCGKPHRSHTYAMGIIIGKRNHHSYDDSWTPGRSILTPTLAILLKHRVKSEHPGYTNTDKRDSRIFWNGHILAVDPESIYPLWVPGFRPEILAPIGELKP